MLEIEKRIQELSESGYKNGKIGTNDEYMYNIYDADGKRRFAVDIQLTSQNYMVFEMYSGIKAADRLFIPSMALYCQEAKCEFGGLVVNSESGDVVYHAESSFIETKIGSNTITFLERQGVDILTRHLNNLLALSVGKRIIDKAMSINGNPNDKASGKTKKNKKNDNKIEDEEIELDENELMIMADTQVTKSCIRYYLMHNSSHSCACENMDEGANPAFVAQAISLNDIYKLEYDFSEKGFLTVRGTYGENALAVPEEYRYNVATYLNDVNSKHLYGHIRIGDGTDGVSCSVITSLRDGDIGIHTIRFMEGVVLSVLKEAARNVMLLSAGMPAYENREGMAVEGLISKLLGANEQQKECMEVPFPNLFDGMDEYDVCDEDEDFDSYEGYDKMYQLFGGADILGAQEEIDNELSMDEYLKLIDSEVDKKTSENGESAAQ